MHNLDMKRMAEITAGVIIIVVLATVLLLLRRRRLQAKSEKFRQRWQTLQHDCSKSEYWPDCVTNADRLLDEALKSSGFKGRTMGERLVSAQRALSDNDGVWFGHKLSNKIAHEEINRLYKRDVQTALMGIRKALQDLGAL